MFALVALMQFDLPWRQRETAFIEAQIYIFFTSSHQRDQRASAKNREIKRI
jgi:hypothetical protein